MKLPVYLAIAALLALPLSPISGTAIAEEAAHSHAHSHGDEAHRAMELNQEQKWETDAPLRRGMSELHQIVSTGLDAAHANTLTSDDYKNISDQIMTQFTYIVENCKLEPEADAQLHILLGNIIQGVEIIEGKVSGQQPEVGLRKMAQALNSYGSYFDHPQWKDLDVSH